MADLLLAMPYLLDSEGHYANTKGDSGGVTWCGIARNKHPNWRGWAIIDKYSLNLHNIVECNSILKKDTELYDAVVEFYATYYWTCKGIRDQRVATKFFDTSVNMQDDGRDGPAVRILQQSVNLMYENIVHVDGVYGPNTEIMVNKCNSDDLLRNMSRLQLNHYHAIVDKHPEDAKFLHGWEHRANRIPEQ